MPYFEVEVTPINFVQVTMDPLPYLEKCMYTTRQNFVTTTKVASDVEDKKSIICAANYYNQINKYNTTN